MRGMDGIGHNVFLPRKASKYGVRLRAKKHRKGETLTRPYPNELWGMLHINRISQFLPSYCLADTDRKQWKHRDVEEHFLARKT